MKDGLPHDYVTDVREAADGSLWVATGGGGIALVRNGRAAVTWSTADGLPSDMMTYLFIDRATCDPHGFANPHNCVDAVAWPAFGTRNR